MRLYFQASHNNHSISYIHALLQNSSLIITNTSISCFPAAVIKKLIHFLKFIIVDTKRLQSDQHCGFYHKFCHQKSLDRFIVTIFSRPCKVTRNTLKHKKSVLDGLENISWSWPSTVCHWKQPDMSLQFFITSYNPEKLPEVTKSFSSC